MSGGFSMALILLTNAGMLLGVISASPFTPAMTQLFPVRTSIAYVDDCIRTDNGTAGAVFCFHTVVAPLAGVGMSTAAIRNPHTPATVRSRTGDLCESSYSRRVRKVLAANRTVPVFHATGYSTGDIYGIMLY